MEALPVAALWALTVVAQKHSLGSVKPETAFVVVTLTHTIFLLAYLSMNWKAIQGDLSNVDRKLSLILLAGVFASFIGNLLYYRVLSRGDASAVTSIVSTTPMFVALFSYLLIRKQLIPRQVFGMGLIIFGVNFL
jgi:transporter family protein